MRTAAVAPVLLTLTACAGATVAPGAVPDTKPAHGLVAIVVDTNTPLESVVFSRPETLDGFTVGAAGRGVTARIIEVPAGRYLLTDFRTPYGVLDSASQQGGQVCLEVREGALSYPGHFVFRDEDEGQGIRRQATWGWRDNRADLDARLRTTWPGLVDRYPVFASTCR